MNKGVDRQWDKPLKDLGLQSLLVDGGKFAAYQHHLLHACVNKGMIAGIFSTSVTSLGEAIGREQNPSIKKSLIL
jgi:hypothetical protein